MTLPDGDGVWTLGYDKNGNVTKDENGQKYVYNAWNQPVSITGSHVALYSYDALGRRITQVAPIASSPSQLETGGPILTINDGTAQRSMIWSLTVTFASPVTLATGAITLTQVGVGAITLNITNPSSDGKTYVITFSESEIIGGSLPNGAYDLTIHSNLVTVNSTGGALAGSDETFAFYPLFGDLAGSGTVGLGDYNALINCFGDSAGSSGYNPYLDYNGYGNGLAAYNALVHDFDKTQTALATADLYYSDQGQVIEEQTGGVTTTQYIWSPFYVNQLVERDDQPDGSGNLTRRLYVEQDANYNVTSLTDSSGNVVERYVYDPYGTVTVENPDGSVEGDGTIASSAYGMVYLFQGGRIDPSTGLYLFGARDYDPTVGRWDEEDPAGYIDGASRYQMELSNPTSLVDPNGLDAGTPQGGNEPGDAIWDGFLGPVLDGLGKVALGIWDSTLGNPGYDERTRPGSVQDQANQQSAALGQGLDNTFLGQHPAPEQEAISGTVQVAMGLALIFGDPLSLEPTCPDAATAGQNPAFDFNPDPAENTSNAGRQGQPKGEPYTHDHYKYNADTGSWERSTVSRDEFGRQTARTDWTDHGRPDDHTDPHYHSTEWNSQYPNGYETGPYSGSYPGH